MAAFFCNESRSLSNAEKRKAAYDYVLSRTSLKPHPEMKICSYNVFFLLFSLLLTVKPPCDTGLCSGQSICQLSAFF